MKTLQDKSWIIPIIAAPENYMWNVFFTFQTRSFTYSNPWIRMVDPVVPSTPLKTS